MTLIDAIAVTTGAVAIVAVVSRMVRKKTDEIDEDYQEKLERIREDHYRRVSLIRFRGYRYQTFSEWTDTDR